MSEVAVLFCKPGAVKPSDKGALRKAGIVVVEVAEPNDVRFVRAEGVLGAQELPHGDLLVAAAKAISQDSYSDNVKRKFGEAIAAAIMLRHGGRPTETRK
jgi:predicted ATPase